MKWTARNYQQQLIYSNKTFYEEINFEYFTVTKQNKWKTKQSNCD